MTTESGGMGFTFARIRASSSPRSRTKIVRLLVDAGAFYTVMSRRTLKALGVLPTEKVRLKVADSLTTERDLGVMHASYRDKARSTYVVFGERGDSPVLGVLALEELRLRVDPKSRRLSEMKVALWVSNFPAHSMTGPQWCMRERRGRSIPSC